MECSICTLKYTEKIRPPATCDTCGKKACRACWQKYFLTLDGDPQCMHCLREIKMIWLVWHTSHIYYETVYKAHRKNILLRYHTARLSWSLERAKYLYATFQGTPFLSRLKFPGIITPMLCWCGREGCHGIVRQGTHTCEVCGTKYCADCFQMVMRVEDDVSGVHSCTPEDIENVKKVKETSQVCPRCHTYIEKESGCNDMFCTRCKAHFNYITGQENEARHNPHFAEMQQLEKEPMQDINWPQILHGLNHPEQFIITHIDLMIKRLLKSLGDKGTDAWLEEIFSRLRAERIIEAISEEEFAYHLIKADYKYIRDKHFRDVIQNVIDVTINVLGLIGDLSLDVSSGGTKPVEMMKLVVSLEEFIKETQDKVVREETHFGMKPGVKSRELYIVANYI